MNLIPKLSIPITQEIVDRYQAKLEKNKRGKLELFLNKFTHAEFESTEVYIRFLNLIRKAELSDRKLYFRALEIFRKQIGLPSEVLEEYIFLVATDKETAISFSKELLMQQSAYFKTMFDSGFVEAHTNRPQINLSKEALESFKKYIYESKVEPSAIDVLKELLDFAQMIEDDDLQEKVSQEIFNFFLNESNDGFYDGTLLEDHSKEFTKQYLEKKQIVYETLPRGSFSISLSSFVSLFSKKDSQILPLIAKEIDTVWIDTNETAMVYTLPQKYRKAIIDIVVKPAFTPSLSGMELLERCFPNTLVNIPLNSFAPVQESEKDAYFYLRLASDAIFSTPPLQFQQAEQNLRKSIELNPRSPIVYEFLGYVCTQQKKYEEAEEYYKKSFEIDSKRAGIYMDYGAFLKERQRFVEAETNFRKAIEICPKDEASYVGLGDLLNSQARYDEAEEFLRKALELSPNNATATLHLCEVLISQGQHTQAETELKKIIALNNPFTIRANFVLGKLYKAQKRLTEAEEALRKSHALNPTDYETRLLYLKVLKSLNNPTLKAKIESEIKKNPDEVRTKIVYAKLLKREGNLKRAMTEIKKILNKSPQCPKAYLLQGKIALEQKKFTAASNSLRKYVELNPNDPRGYFSLSSALSNQKGKAREAEAFFIKAHLLLGNVLKKQKKFAEAEESYLKAVEKDRENVEAHMGLGEVLHLQGKIEESKVYYKNAIQLNPENEDAHKALLHIYRLQNEEDEAKRCEAVLQEMEAGKSQETQMEVESAPLPLLNIRKRKGIEKRPTLSSNKEVQPADNEKKRRLKGKEKIRD